MRIRNLPVPFLILIVAGIISIFSIAANSLSQAGAAKDSPVQVETVEQERMAALYFRILSWLSDVTPGQTRPVKAAPPEPAKPQVVKSPRSQSGQSGIRLCAFHFPQNASAQHASQSTAN